MTMSFKNMKRDFVQDVWAWTGKRRQPHPDGLAKGFGSVRSPCSVGAGDWIPVPAEGFVLRERTFRGTLPLRGRRPGLPVPQAPAPAKGPFHRRFPAMSLTPAASADRTTTKIGFG